MSERFACMSVCVRCKTVWSCSNGDERWEGLLGWLKRLGGEWDVSSSIGWEQQDWSLQMAVVTMEMEGSASASFHSADSTAHGDSHTNTREPILFQRKSDSTAACTVSCDLVFFYLYTINALHPTHIHAHLLLLMLIQMFTFSHNRIWCAFLTENKAKDEKDTRREKKKCEASTWEGGGVPK